MFIRSRFPSLAVAAAAVALFPARALPAGSGDGLTLALPRLALASLPAPARTALPLHEAARRVASRSACANTVVTTPANVNYVGVIGGSALAGAVLGGLVGGAIFLLDDEDHDWSDLGYWAAGGILLGAASGVVQVVVQENRANKAVSGSIGPPPARQMTAKVMYRQAL